MSSVNWQLFWIGLNVLSLGHGWVIELYIIDHNRLSIPDYRMKSHLRVRSHHMSLIAITYQSSIINGRIIHESDHTPMPLITATDQSWMNRKTSHVRIRSHDMHIATVITSHDGFSSRVLGIKSKKCFSRYQKKIEYAILHVKLSSLCILPRHSLFNLHVLCASVTSLTASPVTISRMQHVFNDMNI